ncbi:MAG: heme-copper oxidase subunit III [candidate division Zixibacteria bacterium]|nr:heme-copper oxidase subunit III [candidate division Zixibacteria bacterium]
MSSVSSRTHEPPAFPAKRGRRGNGDDGGYSGGGDNWPEGQPDTPAPSSLSTDVLGMLIFIASEATLFAVLIVAFAVARSGQPEWPPPGQPRLPVLVTSLNTLVLLFSGYTLYRAWRDVHAGYVYSFHRWIGITAFLGMTFLCVQGYEWISLLGYGLTATANLYGAMFYTLVGAHALHVAIAAVLLLVVRRRASQGRYTAEHHDGVIMTGAFWGFVVLVWPVLFAVVYLL